MKARRHHETPGDALLRKYKSVYVHVCEEARIKWEGTET